MAGRTIRTSLSFPAPHDSMAGTAARLRRCSRWIARLIATDFSSRSVDLRVAMQIVAVTRKHPQLGLIQGERMNPPI